MSERSTVRSLFDSSLDIIGDIHGELGALQSLLKKLDYDDHGRHPEGRRLVFVGDLVDRGPDSPGVLRAVMRMVEVGNAQCILGNHELNALRNDAEKGREGEGWWYDRVEPRFDSAPVSAEEKERSFMPFLRGLPIALEREDLRVVHACWHEPSIESLRQSESILDHYDKENEASEEKLRKLKAEADAACRDLGLARGALRDGSRKVPFVPELADHDTESQMGNAVRVVTSGVERPAPDSFFSSGKWRMVERVKWWEEYSEAPVVVGHYWRSYWPEWMAKAGASVPDLFHGSPADSWLGRGSGGAVMCIDYSVGMRFDERAKATTESRFRGCLAALRVPEWELVFDDERDVLSIGAPRPPRTR